MLDDYNLLTTQLVTLWAVLDPIGHLSLFLGATAALGQTERRRAALLSVMFAFCILAAFSVAGQLLLHAMGVSLLSFQIAGGIIVFLFAVSMVLGDGTPTRPEVHKDSVLALAIHPLATPIIAGPGSMLTMVLLMNNNRYSPAQQAITLAALAMVLVVMLSVFLFGEVIRRLIGEGGTNVLRRVMGLVLVALAVNMVLSATALWLHLPEI